MDMPANAKTQTISGKKYVFIDTPYWNAEKHRGEHKRRYIGKIVEGQFVPNGKYLLLLEKSGTIKPGPIPATECNRVGLLHRCDKDRVFYHRRTRYVIK